MLRCAVRFYVPVRKDTVCLVPRAHDAAGPQILANGFLYGALPEYIYVGRRAVFIRSAGRIGDVMAERIIGNPAELSEMVKLLIIIGYVTVSTLIGRGIIKWVIRKFEEDDEYNPWDV